MNVIFKGFETIEQARVFAEWYSGQGEQQSDAWLQEHSDIKYANAGAITETEDSVEVEIKLYKK